MNAVVLASFADVFKTVIGVILALSGLGVLLMGVIALADRSFKSGTVAAVREAVLHGWTGVALSQYKKKALPFDWVRTGRWAARVLAELLARPPRRGGFYNVNFPHLTADEADPEVVLCPLDPHPLPLSYRHEETGLVYDGNYHLRERQPGADVDVCFSGRIAVTELRLF